MPEETNKSLALTPEYVETYKYSNWVKYYTDETNPKTYSNGIQSVFAAYGTHMTYNAAGQIATDNMKKFRHMRSIFAEKAGFTYEKFVKIAISKYMKSDRPEWFEKVKEATGFGDLIPEVVKGHGLSVKTEDKEGRVTEIKIVNYESVPPDA